MVFTGNVDRDYLSVIGLIDSFAKKNNSPINYNQQKIFTTLQYLDNEFCVNGNENSNIFKKASSFLCDFIATRPVDGFEISNEKLKKISNYRNAVIGFHIVCTFIKGATVGDDGVVENPIELSEHSYIDIIDTLSQITPSHHFKTVTVLLEQLVYKSNPELQDTTFKL